MRHAVRVCIVVGYEPLIESLTLLDPDDRHVLAAAIKSGSQVIVTNNARIGHRLQLGQVPSQVPSWEYRLCRFHTVCHGPNTSGRSHDGTAARYR